MWKHGRAQEKNRRVDFGAKRNYARNLEMRTTINEKDISTINKQLEKISLNTTWILRIIIGAIVTGILGLIIKGVM